MIDERNIRPLEPLKETSNSGLMKWLGTLVPEIGLWKSVAVLYRPHGTEWLVYKVDKGGNSTSNIAYISSEEAAKKRALRMGKESNLPVRKAGPLGRSRGGRRGATRHEH